MNAPEKALLQPQTLVDPFVTDYCNDVHDLSQPVESPQYTDDKPHFYTPISDVWKISSNRKNLNFTQSVGMSYGFLKRLKYCFRTQVGVLAEDTLVGVLRAFKKQDFGYDQNNDEFQIDVDAVRAYVFGLRTDADITDRTKSSYHWHILSIARWSKLLLRPKDQLFTPEAFELLEESKFKSVRNAQHDDPEKGRYDIPTLTLLQERIRSAWNNGVDSELTREEFILMLLLFSFGMRPIQLSRLKACDLEVKSTETGKVYTLHTPFAKQPRKAARTLFESLVLDNSLGELIEKHVIESGLKTDCGLFQLKDSPAFKGKPRESRGLFKGHTTSTYITKLMSNLRERLNLPFATNAKRFRSTVGTKMYRTLGPTWAGKILTHTRSESINSYASLKVMADAVEGMAEAIHGDSLELLDITNSFLKNVETIEAVGAFQGQVVQGMHRPAAKLLDLNLSELPRGACGTANGACTKNHVGLPYACYTCKHMLALSTGPHRVYLEHTIDLYLGLKNQGLEEQANQYLAPMFGMAQVIQLIIKEHGHD